MHPPPVQALTRKNYYLTQVPANLARRARENPQKRLPPSLRSVANETGCSPNHTEGININPMPTTKRRPGSNTAEMKDRYRWAPVVATGTITCRRCHKPIKPGEEWEMGHPIDAPYAAGNHDWTTRRPEHKPCNRSGLVFPEPEPTFSW